jgi:type IV fimbrial biogenesis protein FimT
MDVTTHARRGYSQAHRPLNHGAQPIGTSRQRAISLFDMLVTLVVAGTLTALAVPAFNQLTARTRITTQVNRLLTDLHLARSEAIKRGQQVVLCKSRNGRRCSEDGAWQHGWVVFVDGNLNHLAEPDESVIHVQDTQVGVETHLNASGSGAQRNHYLGFRPDGMSGKRGTFTFCDPTAPASARAIVIYWTGRARVSGKTAEGLPLTCPVDAGG